MAIYHLAMKPISRSGGRSAVAAAAYRASQKLTNERDGLTHDFTRKGGVEHSEIVHAGRLERRMGQGPLAALERRRGIPRSARTRAWPARSRSRCRMS